MGDIVYLNGEFISLAEAHVSVDDRGFNFADGVYEVIHVYKGRPFKMEEHFIRLQQSAQGLEINLPDYNLLMELAMELLEKNEVGPAATIYIQLTRGTQLRSHLYLDDLEPNVVMFARDCKPKPQEYFTDGVKVILVPDERWPRCYIKSISLLPNILYKKVANRAGAFEAIQVRDGFITEGTSSNVFIVKEGKIITPPASNYILNGITRQVILQEALKLGYTVLEKSISQAEFLDADEVFLTGTTTEVMPVVEVDKQIIGDGKPGPIAQALYQYYQELHG